MFSLFMLYNHIQNSSCIWLFGITLNLGGFKNCWNLLTTSVNSVFINHLLSVYSQSCYVKALMVRGFWVSFHLLSPVSGNSVRSHIFVQLSVCSHRLLLRPRESRPAQIWAGSAVKCPACMQGRAEPDGLQSHHGQGVFTGDYIS